MEGLKYIPYAGQVFGAEEREAMHRIVDREWITLGPEGEAFEDELAKVVDARRSLICNSGSSANLLAISALTSHKLSADVRLKPGDEVITLAAGFPTTVFPIVQVGAVPVFMDSDPATGNVRTEHLEFAKSERTKAVIFAHTLGNPFDVDAVSAFCKKHHLWLIEDNCDALGSTYRNRPTGSFGHLSTQSFYPPHHITMGEGGAVNVNGPAIFGRIIDSLRGWGRDCWCPCGEANTCQNRFGWNLGELPHGYDHKYTYSHFGYNLKPLDIQAALGRVQLRRLPEFTAARRDNWRYLRQNLGELGEFFGFMEPLPEANPSWFGFMLRVKRGSPFSNIDLMRHLESKRIGSRMLFAGNLVHQPVFVNLKKDRPNAFRVIGSLQGADELMNTALFLGVYPGLTREMLDYEIETIKAFVKSK